ncbi:hypothetical protein CR513_19640, partial [Mucuna pruriens]
SQSNSVESVRTQPRPSQIDLCRDRPGQTGSFLTGRLCSSPIRRGPLALSTMCRKESQLEYILEELGTLSRIVRQKVVKGDRLACHHTLVDLILSILTNRGEPSPFKHGDRRGRFIKFTPCFLIPISCLRIPHYNLLVVLRLHIVKWTNVRLGRSEPRRLNPSLSTDSKPDVYSKMPQQDKTVPLPFPTRTPSTRKPEYDKELLRMFRKVEINIPLLDSIKQNPKYAKFLKELNEEFTTGAQQALPKKCQNPGTFPVPCVIGDCTFTNAMLDLGASINIMPTSIYKSLNFGDLEPTRMTKQLANRSVVQLLGVLEDVLVQVNEVIFPAGFYVLDMEDKTSGKGSTLI